MNAAGVHHYRNGSKLWRAPNGEWVACRKHTYGETCRRFVTKSAAQRHATKEEQE